MYKRLFSDYNRIKGTEYEGFFWGFSELLTDDLDYAVECASAAIGTYEGKVYVLDIPDELCLETDFYNFSNEIYANSYPEELDESFHYSDRNNALLYNHIIETAKTNSLNPSLDNKILSAEQKQKSSNLKEYELIICKDEPEEETVRALLTKDQVSVIKDDLDGILSSEFHITTVDGRKIETGIIDVIKEVKTKDIGRDVIK